MKYPGGKNGSGTYQTIINQIPSHMIYSEFFTGSAAIYRHMSRSNIAFLFDKFRKQLPSIKKSLSPGHSAFCFDSVANIDFLVGVFNLFHSLGFPVFVYADPPYPISSRSCQQKMYQHEMSDADHIAFLNGARASQFHMAISTYKNDIYSEMLKDWRLLQYQSIIRGGTRTEFLYMNYPEPSQLHDYSYIGKDFREREKFMRIQKNALSKLNAMPAVLLHSILKNLENESKI